MSDNSERPPAVMPGEAAATLSRLKLGLIRHLEEAVARVEGQEVEPVENFTLIIEDSEGNPIQVERARLENDRIFVSGYIVDDLGDQCLPTDDTELDSDELSRLDAETLVRIVSHFAP